MLSKMHPLHAFFSPFASNALHELITYSDNDIPMQSQNYEGINSLVKTTTEIYEEKEMSEKIHQNMLN